MSKSFVRSIVLFATVLAVPLGAFGTNHEAFLPESSKGDFDRLDGTGKSRKRVDVIEWEGNLEIHVYPKGSLAGLAAKLESHRGKKVMILGYRFKEDPRVQRVRRNVVSIPFPEQFHVYQDPVTDDYDKVVLTPHELGRPLFAFNLDPEPSQKFPSGHPALADGGGAAEPNAITESRKPASGLKRAGGKSEDGAIEHFTW